MAVSEFEHAQALRNNGEIDGAIEVYKILRKNNLKQNPQFASECLHMIGVAYYQAENFDEANQYLERAHGEFEQRDNQEFIGFVLRDLGLVAQRQGRLDEASDYMNESIDMLRKTGNKGHEGISRVKLGRIFADRSGGFSRALGEINMGIELLNESNEKFFLSSAYLDRAEVYFENGQENDAKADIDKSLELLDSISSESEYVLRRREIQDMLEKIDG